MSLNSTTHLELSVDCYATFEDILAHIPHVTLDNSNSKPSRAQACGIARDVFREINSMLSVLGYLIPVASGNITAIGLVGRMCAVGTARSLDAAAASVDGRSSDTADFLRKEYDRMWGALRDGEITLPGAARTGNPIRHRGERKPAYSFHQPSAGTESSPIFTRDMEW